MEEKIRRKSSDRYTEREEGSDGETEERQIEGAGEMILRHNWNCDKEKYQKKEGGCYITMDFATVASQNATVFQYSTNVSYNDLPSQLI